MATTTNWRPVVAAAIASRRADCGHALSPRNDAIVWVRKELVGGNYELYTLCSDCMTDDDYMYRLAYPDWAPKRIRTETL